MVPPPRGYDYAGKIRRREVWDQPAAAAVANERRAAGRRKERRARARGEGFCGGCVVRDWGEGTNPKEEILEGGEGLWNCSPESGEAGEAKSQRWSGAGRRPAWAAADWALLR
uniref:Uncharacterized protein n=1 Tax=Oryza glumipatula TaxID=40148 RepID=A0A0D9YV18_9ORYZ